MDYIFTLVKSFLKWTVIFWALIFAIGFALDAKAETANPPVKMSSSKICHSVDSQYYNRTKNYTAYETMEACVAAGGRAPK